MVRCRLAGIMPGGLDRTSCRCSATSPGLRRTMLDLLTCLSVAHPARPSASLESASAWTIRAATSRLSSWRWLDAFAPVGWSGRMWPVFCRMTGDGRWAPSSGSWGNSGMGGPTGCLTLSMSEWACSDGLCPSDGVVCSLSDVLETRPVPRRYYLTARACAGILRRAARRGKGLPAFLHSALMAIASTGAESVLQVVAAPGRGSASSRACRRR